jgi:hypothetical protein
VCGQADREREDVRTLLLGLVVWVLCRGRGAGIWNAEPPLHVVLCLSWTRAAALAHTAAVVHGCRRPPGCRTCTLLRQPAARVS